MRSFLAGSRARTLRSGPLAGRSRFEGEIRSWGAFLGSIARRARDSRRPSSGAGIRILTETITSPTLADADRSTCRSSTRRPNGTSGNRPVRTAPAPAPLSAFGQPVNTYYDLAKANVIVSLDSDFLPRGPASLRYARQFAAERRVRGEQTEHEPAVRGGADADAHGHQGRSSPAVARRRTSKSSPGRWRRSRLGVGAAGRKHGR